MTVYLLKLKITYSAQLSRFDCVIIETGNNSYRLQQQQNLNLNGEDKSQ